MDERVTLYSDPADADCSDSRSTPRGFRSRRMVWIEKGILKNLCLLAASGRRSRGRQPTGSAIRRTCARGRHRRATDELIAGCERGILVTHFFYIRASTPRTVLQTGSHARRRVPHREGQVTQTAEELPLEREPALMLNRLEDIGRPEPTAAGRLMPALRVRDFNFSSLSDAV